MSYPLNALRLLPYDYQFLMYFTPTLDEDIQNFPGVGEEHAPRPPRWLTLTCSL